MIPVIITFDVDPETTPGLGFPAPVGPVLLPFSTFDEWKASGLFSLKAFKPDAAKAARALALQPSKWEPNTPRAPEAVVACPLISEEVMAFLLKNCPVRGPVEPLEPFDPELLACLVREYHLRQAKIPVDCGDVLDPEGALLAHDLDLAARDLGIPRAKCFEIFRSRFSSFLSDERVNEVIDATISSGFSPAANRRDQVWEEIQATRKSAARDVKFAADALARATELVEYDLQKEGIVVQTMTQTKGRPGLGIYGSKCQFQKVEYFLTGGLPITDGAELLPGVILTAFGTVKMTRAQRAKVAALHEETIELIRFERLSGKDDTYVPSDFAGLDPLTVEGRWALDCLKEAAAFWVKKLATTESHRRTYDTDVTPRMYVEELLYGLPVAFGGKVTIPQSIAAIRGALVEYVAALPGGGYGAYDSSGVRVPNPPAANRWPDRLPQPSAVRDSVLKAIARLSPWVFGELAHREPSAENLKTLRVQLQPDLFASTVKAACAGKDFLRSEDVYSALHAEGLAAVTPNPTQRAAASKALMAAGYVRVDTKVGGQRQRGWKLSAAPAAPVPTLTELKADLKAREAEIHSAIKVRAEAREAKEASIARGLELLATDGIAETLARLGDRAPRVLRDQLAQMQQENAASIAANNVQENAAQ